jgi:uncharacterized protein YbjT (DUF2867 family)
MPAPPDTVLVTGATGRQGGAVARNLLGDGVDVRALTRSPGSAAAAELDERGASVVEGDLTDRESLETAVEGVDGVYCVTTWEAGVDEEMEQGTTLAAVAAEADVDHFVFSSAWGADRDADVPFFDAKRAIEHRLASMDLPVTVVRPAFFMQNFEGMRDEVRDGRIALALAPRVPLYLVDVDDVGAFVAEAFQQPRRYAGNTYDLAGDELTLSAMAVRFSAITGVDVTAHHLPVEHVEERMGTEYAALYRWFNRREGPIDLSHLRTAHDVEFALFQDYLLENDWR